MLSRKLSLFFPNFYLSYLILPTVSTMGRNEVTGRSKIGFKAVFAAFPHAVHRPPALTGQKY